MNQVVFKIRNLIDYLNYHTKQYDQGTPEITDAEWDTRYFELAELEKEHQLYFNDSPTQSISYTVVNSLEKVVHNHDMLSLEKTKALSEIKDFLGNVPYLAMCKMDGLTCSLKYYDGVLVSAETRGDGQVGENILHNARVLPSIPKAIPYKGLLIVDGEIICSKHDFKAFENEYKNPRNFAAGSVRLLDASECAKRKLQFVVWDVIQGLDECKYLSEKLLRTAGLGFTVVPYCHSPSYDAIGNKMTDEDFVYHLTTVAEDMGYPIDGMVFKFDDVEYGRSLGQTAHHFRNAMAYKFYDETYPTTLLDIEWSMGRTGVLTPIAIFEPIDIDGSTVERASLHNWTVLNDTLHGRGWRGQKVEVFKANMIIPQIAKAEKDDECTKDYFDYPHVCPICGEPTILREDTDSSFVVCTNSSCEGQFINRLDHFCGKKGLDIRGLSQATLEKLIEWGYVNNLSDLFLLSEVSADWKRKPGFGPKSVSNILSAVEVSRLNCEPDKFIAALGIPLIGASASKELIKRFHTWEAFVTAAESGFKFYELPNFGGEMHSAIVSFDYTEAKDIVNRFITFVSNEQPIHQGSSLDGQTFVITGKVSRFKNRDAVKEAIEAAGGKVVGSVSKSTKYLINNDTTSTSAKNKAAQSLGIPIISEEDLISMLGMSD